MSYDDIKKKYGKTASERSGKVKLAQMKVERMQAAYDTAYEDWQEAGRRANTNICKETAEALREAAAAKRKSELRLIEAKCELDAVNVPEPELADIVEHIC